MMSHFRVPLAALAGAAALAAPAAAQAPTAAPGELRMNLAYDGRLLVKVLDINITQTADRDSYTSNVRMRSSGVLSAFKKIEQNATASGALVHGEVRPRVFSQKNIDGEDTRAVRVNWTGGDVITTAQPAYRNLGHPPASRAQKLEAIDPVTALMHFTLADSQAQLCTGSARFFDGKRRYDLVFSARSTRAPNAREQRLGLLTPVTCNATYREIAGFKRKKEKNSGLKRPFTITFAQAGQGGPWVISTLTGPTPLGNAVIDLQRVNVTGRTPG